MTAQSGERSLGELFGELSQQTSTLVKKEIELARLEMTRSASDMARNAAMGVAGALFAYAGAIVVLIGLGWLLASLGLPLWVAFVIVGGLTLAIGGFLGYRALDAMRKARLMPERTVETIKEDVEWAKEQAQ